MVINRGEKEVTLYNQKKRRWRLNLSKILLQLWLIGTKDYCVLLFSDSSSKLFPNWMFEFRLTQKTTVFLRKLSPETFFQSRSLKAKLLLRYGYKKFYSLANEWSEDSLNKFSVSYLWWCFFVHKGIRWFARESFKITQNTSFWLRCRIKKLGARQIIV